MEQFYGLASVPLIREVVKLTGFSGILAVLSSIIVGILFNLALALLVGNPPIQAIAVGFVAAVLSNIYNDVREIINKV